MFLRDLPLTFHYVLYFHYTFFKIIIDARTIPAFNLQKSIISSIGYLRILFTLILSKDKKLLSQIEFSVLILLIVLLQNQDH